MKKLNQWMKVVLIATSVFTLAACSSARKSHDDAAVNDENASSNVSAQTSGAGDDSSFGDQAGGKRQLAKRTYYFDFDSNVVHSTDKPAIGTNANYLTAHTGTKVLLEGHTDPRGSREYNIGLGERRAKAVAEILTQQGVDPTQIRVVSYGAEKLAAAGRTDTDFQLDRRVVLVYVQR